MCRSSFSRQLRTSINFSWVRYKKKRMANLSAFFMASSVFRTSPTYSQTKVPCGIGSAALIAQPCTIWQRSKINCKGQSGAGRESGNPSWGVLHLILSSKEFQLNKQASLQYFILAGWITSTWWIALIYWIPFLPISEYTGKYQII